MNIYFCVGVNTALCIMTLLRVHQIAAGLKRLRPRPVTRQGQKNFLDALHQIGREQMAKTDPQNLE